MKEKKILDKCNKSKFIIAICMKRDDKDLIPEWEEITSTSMAVQTCGFLVHLEILGVTGALPVMQKT